MNRKRLPFIAILAALLVAAAIAVLLLRPSAPAPIVSGSLPEENAIDPVRVEMDCIDRVLANNNLKSEEVQLALDRCRSQGASETRLVNSQ